MFSEIEHKSIVFLSDSTHHDTAAVHTVQEKLVEEIKKTPPVKKIIHSSDGAKQHFKNRFQMMNLMHHEEDCGIKGEWHFHAIGHGKGTPDDVGALFKRAAARTSLLLKPEDAISSPQKVLDRGKNHFHMMGKSFYSAGEHDQVQKFLKERFNAAPGVPNIMRNHRFIQISLGVLLNKICSTDDDGVQFLYRE